MKTEKNQIQIGAPRHQNRPTTLAVLIILVLFFTAINAIQVIAAFTSWDFLVAVLPSAPLPYIVSAGVFWFIAGLILVFGLFSGKKWSLIFSRIAIVLYFVIFWIDRFLIAEIVFIQNRWQFFLGLSLILIILAFWLLEHKNTKSYLVK